MGLHNVAGTPSNCATHNQPQHERCHNQFDVDWFSVKSFLFQTFPSPIWVVCPVTLLSSLGRADVKFGRADYARMKLGSAPVKVLRFTSERAKRTTFSTERGLLTVFGDTWGCRECLQNIAFYLSLKINHEKHDDNEDSGGPRQWFSISDRTTENVNLPVCTRNAGNKFYLGRKHSISIFITDTITVFVNKVQIVTKIISTRCFPLEPFPPKSGP